MFVFRNTPKTSHVLRLPRGTNGTDRETGTANKQWESYFQTRIYAVIFLWVGPSQSLSAWCWLHRVNPAPLSLSTQIHVCTNNAFCRNILRCILANCANQETEPVEDVKFEAFRCQHHHTTHPHNKHLPKQYQIDSSQFSLLYVYRECARIKFWRIVFLWQSTTICSSTTQSTSVSCTLPHRMHISNLHLHTASSHHW